MNTENRIVLPDGRTLAYAEFGQADGYPVLYFHGAPSSRLEPLLIGDEAFVRLGLRVIAPDRPGIGGSDFQRGRGFSHWPSDVVSLADALGLGQFALLGNSGGGPYVAVCAARIPNRIRAAVIVSGGWRMDWPEATDGTYENEAHLSTLCDHFDEVAQVLMNQPPGNAGVSADQRMSAP